jgi:hypothetical protein
MKVFRFLFLSTVTLLIASATLMAQAPPQDANFVKLCDLYGSANSGGSAWGADENCPLPKNFKLDNSYHQTNFSCCGGGATSNISMSDIPAGIHIQIDGGHYWSVVKPMGLMTLEEDDEGRAVSRQFFIHTYCGPAGRPGPGCNVKVTVWAKKKS